MGGLTKELLHSLLNYDPNTGVFVWLVNRGRLAKVGGVAGRVDTHGYVQITINGKSHLAHRLAFMYVGNEIPKCVDHVNGIRSDNRISNLRSATVQQNKFNAHYSAKTKSVGITRKVYKCGTRYEASFRAKGYSGKRYLGLFKTEEEAKAAYLNAALTHYGADFVSASVRITD